MFGPMECYCGRFSLWVNQYTSTHTYTHQSKPVYISISVIFCMFCPRWEPVPRRSHDPGVLFCSEERLQNESTWPRSRQHVQHANSLHLSHALHLYTHILFMFNTLYTLNMFTNILSKFDKFLSFICFTHFFFFAFFYMFTEILHTFSIFYGNRVFVFYFLHVLHFVWSTTTYFKAWFQLKA